MSDLFKAEYDLAQDWFISSWPDVVRWILVVPGAFLGSIIIPGILYAIASSGDESGPVSSGSIHDVLLRLAQTVLFGGLFVYLGAAIAPKKQLLTGFLLFLAMAPLLLLIGMLLLQTPSTSTHDITGSSNFLILNLLLTYFSGAGALFAIYKELK